MTVTTPIELKKIPAGSDSEGNQFKAFEMGKTPITQRDWISVMGSLPDENGTYMPSYPITQVSYDDAVLFCKKLSEQTGDSYRLPTEEEWEYACRAGADTAYHFGDSDENLSDYAWYSGNCDSVQPVGTKLPNDWGLHDMHGLVWEWTSSEHA
jgi:formylglycine-generating enzyme required for sulfatase activity